MKKVKLVNVGSNKYSVLGAFARQAKKDGWTESEINKVIEDAVSGDYDHLLITIGNRCE